MMLMATATAVEPVTPRYAMYPTMNAVKMAHRAMNAGPGLEALMKLGQICPAR